MTNPNKDSRLDEVIVCLLKLVGAPIYRTQLVKLVYFVDYIHFQHTGSTLTGLRYVWDNFGPNAVNNQIVITADELTVLGSVHMQAIPNFHGETSYLYRAEEGTECPTFDPLADVILRDVVTKYRSYNAREIAEASKRTEPFQKARQGDILNFERASAYYLNPLSPEPSTLEEIEAGSRGKSLEELREKYQIA